MYGTPSPVIVLSTNYHHPESTKKKSIAFFSRPHTRDPLTPTTVHGNRQGTYAQESEGPSIHKIKCQGTTRRPSSNPLCKPCTPHVNKGGTRPISSPVIVLSTNYHHPESTKKQSIAFFSRPHTRDPLTPTTVHGNCQETYAQESEGPPIHKIKCQGTTRRPS